MLETSGADIDPAIFQKDNYGDFSFVIGLTVGRLEQSGEIIRLHDEFDAEAATQDVTKMIEEEGGEVADVYERLLENAGEEGMNTLIGKIGQFSGHTAPPVTEQEYEEALNERKFFDGVMREEFGERFKHMEEDRGPAVQANVCARTFYAIMQDHVPRAIIGANRDEWTGYQ